MILHPEKLSEKELHRLYISCIVPRPIAWITTLSSAGIVNAAPFSFFMGVSSEPPTLALSIDREKGNGALKDTLRNLRENKEFVVNFPNEELAEAMNITSAEYSEGVSELDEAGLHSAASERVKVPRIAEAPVAFECTLINETEVHSCSLILGEVVAFYIREDLLVHGAVAVEKFQPVGRMGRLQYCRAKSDIFEMARPKLK